MYAPPRPAALARFATSLCLLSAGYAALYLVRTYDSLFHLAAGRYMLAHAELLSRDPFSFSFPGAPWTNHSPLFQLALAQLHALGGFAALSIHQAVCAIALVGIGLWSVRRLPAGQRSFAALLMAAACLGLREVLEARPHVVGFMALAICAHLALQAERLRSAGRLCIIPAVYALWSLSHGSHVLVYPLLALGAAAALRAGERALLAGFTLAALACLGLSAGFAPRAFSQGFEHVGSLVLEQSVSEWRALTVADVLGTWPGRLFAAAWSLSALGLWFSWRDARRVRAATSTSPATTAVASELYPMLLLLGSLLLSLSSRRMIALFLFGCAPIWLGFALRAAARCLAGRRLPEHFAWLLCGLGFVALWTAGFSQRATFRSGAGLATERVPIEAVQKLREQPRLERIYNAYNYGGYLMLEGVPVFVDGRSITLYPAEFLREFQRAYMDPAVFERLVARFACDGALLPVDSRPAARLRAHLAGSPRWRLIHRDSVAELYERL